MQPAVNSVHAPQHTLPCGEMVPLSPAVLLSHHHLIITIRLHAPSAGRGVVPAAG